MQVDRAAQPAVLVHHRRGGDFALHQHLFGFNGAALGIQRQSALGHCFGYPRLQLAAAHQPAAQVAVGEDALHLAVIVAYRNQPQPGAAQLQHGVHHAGVEFDLRNGIVGAHQVVNLVEQTCPKRARRMGAGEIFLIKTARLHHRHCQRVAHHQGVDGAGGRCQVHRTGFALNGNIQRCFRGQRQRRSGFAGHR